jgi:hypothetical protein
MVSDGGEVCISELRDAWIRCLLLVEHLLKNTRTGFSDEGIRGKLKTGCNKISHLRALRDSVICLALQFDDVLVRKNAITCLGVYALLDTVLICFYLCVVTILLLTFR